MTPDEIAESRRICEVATVRYTDYGHGTYEFAHYARTALPAALDEIERLRAEAKKWKEKACWYKEALKQGAKSRCTKIGEWVKDKDAMDGCPNFDFRNKEYCASCIARHVIEKEKKQLRKKSK